MPANSARVARQGRSPDRAPLAAALLVLLLSMAVYLPVWDGGFLLRDDTQNIRDNPRVQSFSAENLRWIARGTGPDSQFKPLAWLGYALIHEAFGMSAPAFHRVAIALHGVNALLVFAFLFRLLTLAEGWKSRRVLNAATLGALFWSLHPLRVESVAWISGLPDSIATCFLLLALIAFLQTDRRRPWRMQACHWLSPAAYAAALLSSPIVAAASVLPFALAICPLKLITLESWHRLFARHRTMLARLSPYFLLAGISTAVAVGSASPGEWVARSIQRLPGEPVHAIWPFPLHPVNLADEGPLAGPRTGIALALLLLVGAGRLWRLRASRPWALAMGLAGLAVLVPGGGQHATAGLILAALLGGALAQRVPTRQANYRLALAAAAILPLGATSFVYAAVWGDDFTQFTAQADTLPDGRRRATALVQLGRLQFEHQDLTGANASYAAAAASDPDYPNIDLPWNHASALAAAGQLPAAAEQYAHCLRLEPAYEPAWHQLGGLLFHLGERRRGEAVFEQGLRQHPQSVAMVGAYANALMAADDLPAALSLLRFQERLHPEEPAVRTMREQAEALLKPPASP